MNKLSRTRTPAGPRWTYTRDERTFLLDADLDEMLAMDRERMREYCHDATVELELVVDGLPPVDNQDIWGAGVTYRRSREGRHEESRYAGVYTDVFAAERPELFFKAAGAEVVGNGGDVGIRHDSEFDAPEPEVAVVVNSRAEIVGYTIANDVTSRGIEGENPIYLPQAKIFTNSCALGPHIVPAWDVDGTGFEIAIRILRSGKEAFAGRTSTSQMTRSFEELVAWLYRSIDFPRGVVLMTGTGIVPDADFTLQDGDRIDIEVEMLGRLTNTVRRLVAREA